MPERLWEVDAARGLAIVLMVTYHLFFDLYFLELVPIDVLGGGWLVLARTSSTLFQLLVGVSLVLSWQRRARQGQDFVSFVRHSWRRAITILFWAAVITLVTWLAARQVTIWFGILHLIGVSVVVAAPLVRWPKVALGLAAAVWWLGGLIDGMVVASPWLFWLGIPPVGFQSLDYWPLLPWTAVILLGIPLGYVLFPDGKRRRLLPKKFLDRRLLFNWHRPLNWLNRTGLLIGLSWIGRRSLAVYLVHQPLILASLWLAFL